MRRSREISFTSSWIVLSRSPKIGRSVPIWARYYEIGTDRPIFGDRDKTIHDDVNEISRERRMGYGWFNDTAKQVAQHYAKWAKLHPQKN